MKTDEIVFRIRANFKLKIALSFILTLGIFSLYLYIQRHSLFPITVMPLTPFDKAIPFKPDYVYLYETICLLTSIAPWLMISRQDLYRYTIALLFITFLCFFVHIVFPFSITRPPVLDNTNLLYLTLIKYDNELNAFPSFHVILSVYHGYCCHLMFAKTTSDKIIRSIIWIWVLAIIFSTLFTRQHNIFDVLGGVIVGVLGCLIYNYKNIFFPYLLNSKRITHDIIAIRDGFVNFFVIKMPEGLICIDSGWRSSVVRREFEKFGLDTANVIAVFLTHTHRDHSNCCDQYHNAEVYSKNAQHKQSSSLIRDGEIIKIGMNSVQAIDTPGHSTCSVSYLVNDKYLFSGDTIRIKNDKIYPFYYVFNHNNKLIKKSISQLSKMSGIEYLLTAHHGTTSNVKEAFEEI
jgi:hydroxyacylglutathione hydrolase